MITYADSSQSPDGWNITSTLKHGDDRFLTECVEGSMYHQWVAGREREPVERSDTLDFGGGYRLRIPPEREVDIPVRNGGTKPLYVVLEPWGTCHVVAPGEQVRVVARGFWGPTSSRSSAAMTRSFCTAGAGTSVCLRTDGCSLGWYLSTRH